MENLKNNAQTLPENSMLLNHEWVGEDWRFEVTIPKPDCKNKEKMGCLDKAMQEFGYSLDKIAVGSGYERRIYKSK